MDQHAYPHSERPGSAIDSVAGFRAIYENSPIAIGLYDAQGRLIDCNLATRRLFGVADPSDLDGFCLFADPNLTDEAKDLMRRHEVAHYAGAFDFEKVRLADLYRTTRSGVIYLEVLVTPLLTGDGLLSGYLAQVQDITARVRSSRLHDALYAISRDINSTLNEREITELVLRDASAALSCESAVLVFCEEPGWLVGQVWGRLSTSLLGRHLATERVPDFELVRAAREVVSRPDALAEGLPSAALAGEYGIRSFLIAPLVDRDRFFGAVAFLWHSAAVPLGEDERDFAQKLGASISLAIGNARLYERARYEQARWEATVESMLDPVTVSDAEGRAIYMNAAYEELTQRTVRSDLQLQQHPEFYQLYRPDGTLYPPTELPLQRATLRGEDVRGVEVVQRTAGGLSIVAIWNASPLRGPDGRVQGAVAVGHEITQQRRNEAERETLLLRLQGTADELRARNADLERAQAELRLRNAELERVQADLRLSAERLENRVQERTAELSRRTADLARNEAELRRAVAALGQQEARLRVLHELEQAILAAESPEEIAAAAARRVRQVLGCQRAAVAVYDEEQHAVQWLAVDTGRPTQLPAGDSVAMEDYTPFMAHRAGRDFAVADVEARPSRTPREELLLAEGIRSYVSLPLRASERRPENGDGSSHAAPGEAGSTRRLIGALHLGWLAADAYRDEDLEFARQVADSLAVAMQNARLDEQVRTSRRQLQNLSRRLAQAREYERSSLARELYDHVGQQMAVLLIRLGVLSRHCGADARTGQLMTEVKTLADQILADLHQLAVNLRPASLDKLGLVPALRQYIESFGEQQAMAVTLEVQGLHGVRLSQAQETALYRSVQEALINVARHSRARHVGVLVRGNEQHVLAIVEDDGEGFDPHEGLARGRMGLFGMRERLEDLGGRLTVESRPGEGASVFIELPYEPRQPE